MKATDFNITSAKNPYNGVWESEFYEIIIHTTPDNYVAFVQNYYGMKQLQEAYKKGDLFFLVNKSNLSGKQYERSSSLTKDYKISDLKIQLKNSTALEIIYPYLGREHRVKFYKAQ